ncbi:MULTISPECIES: metal-dependent transcriptional regulator [Robiginitalea]|uniref:Transcriptional regulator MntR n=1 Tax=Robiginitalea biformata (strain ATCC BAA-864 / DSM 15991 / KCTC 12146 / HTCC2501) TaxID=313596 RepID=A4CHD1_ROBBH|nr:MULTISPECIES: metal-dependent transcriptional regulator [Robiginitalea]EAR16339.1 iron dependent repressor [Robiginitalea biformata HTCC2501]MDC6353395.1 metal-dependent transcriptional regulator [Robiginitalea sp. PM2]MDC6373440.1 metal-dependent transcriptional regulator [Robiginitalea sp. SP8]
MTHSEENYLKGIYHLCKGGSVAVATNAIAAQMDTKPSSVTDMVKRLSEKGLVDYRKYQGVSLTESGNRQALKIIRKHRLWELFLVEKLDFKWDQVHEIAEQLEHIESEVLIDRLDALLEYPDYDPHGDPIPDKNGVFKTREKKLLSAMPVPSEGQFVGVKDSSATFLRFLDRHRIALGKKVSILEKEEFDKSMRIRLDGEAFRISHQIASNLYIKPNNAS